MAIILQKSGSYLEQNQFNRYNSPLTERNERFIVKKDIKKNLLLRGGSC